MKNLEARRKGGKEKRFFFLLFICHFLLSTAFATTYKTLTLEDLVTQAEIAFYGKVSKVEVIEREGEPWTQVSFTVTEALFGTENEATETLNFYGGTLDSGLSLTINLMPQFFAEEKVLILAYKDDYYSPIVGFRQGLWRNKGQGFIDEIGRKLSWVEGSLELDGTSGSDDDILSVFKAMFEKRGKQ
jgi:hypothetical protein